MAELSRHEVKRLFLTQKAAARALGISAQAISYWPDPIGQRRSDEIIGAAMRHGICIPSDILAKHKKQ